MHDEPRWITPEQAARSIGVTPKWVRDQIAAGRLPATAWSTGTRPFYRISLADWRSFCSQYGRRTTGGQRE